MPLTAAEVMHIGQGRLTAGLDRMQRLDLPAHRAVFGELPAPTAGELMLGVLPLQQAVQETRLTVDWTRCRGHGLCAHLVPELVQLDGQGYPDFLDMPVPSWLAREAAQAVEMCPSLALTLTRSPARPAGPEAGLAAGPPGPDGRLGGPGRLAFPAPGDREDLVVTEAWISQISGVREISG